MSDTTASITQPEKPKVSKTAGCLGIIILIFVISWVAEMAGCDPSSQVSDSYRAGREIGFLDGNMAMRSARPRATNEEKERVAWSIASRFTSETEEAKKDWVQGYKAGWDAGYSAH